MSEKPAVREEAGVIVLDVTPTQKRRIKNLQIAKKNAQSDCFVLRLETTDGVCVDLAVKQVLSFEIFTSRQEDNVSVREWLANLPPLSGVQ